jgi:hypothetical protein
MRSQSHAVDDLMVNILMSKFYTQLCPVCTRRHALWTLDRVSESGQAVKIAFCKLFSV